MAEQEININDYSVIDTDEKANWAARKIKEARDRRDEFVAWYEQKIKEINEQTDAETATLEARLADYFANVPHKVTKTQESYSFPGGKLVLKRQNPEFKRDDKTIIEWARTNAPQYIKTEERLDWASLKDATGTFEGTVVTEDGEIIPGIEVVERPAKFVVDV